MSDLPEAAPGAAQEDSSSAPAAHTPGSILRSWRVRLYMLALLSDELATALWVFTLGWGAARLGDPVTAGWVLFAGGVPYVALLLVGGSLTDLLGSPRVAAWTLGARFGALGMFWVVTRGEVSAAPVQLAVAAAVLGAIGGVHYPAMTAYPAVLLPPAAQSASMVLERGIARTAQAGGGYLAGVATSRLGDATPAALGAMLLAAAVGVMLCIRPARGVVRISSSAPGGAAPRVRVTEGIRWVGRHPVLRRTLAVQAATSAMVAALLLALLPQRASLSGWSAAFYGQAFGLFGAGMLTGTAVAIWATQRGRAGVGVPAAVWLAALGCLAALAAGVAPAPGLASLAALVSGIAFGPVGPTLSGYLRGQASSGAAVGQVMAVLLLVTDAAEPLMLMTASWLVGGVGVDLAAVLFAGACGLTCAAAGVGLSQAVERSQ